MRLPFEESQVRPLSGGEHLEKGQRMSTNWPFTERKSAPGRKNSMCEVQSLACWNKRKKTTWLESE